MTAKEEFNTSRFEQQLSQFLARVLPDFESLDSYQRLSGGASQETFALDVVTTTGPQKLALRRASGIRSEDHNNGQIGLTNEARVIRAAATAEVPVPHILGVLEPADDLGEGFLMPWLSGETLGRRIVRDQQFDNIRPKLAAQCGKILAQIHSLDVKSLALDQYLPELTPEQYVEQQWQLYRALNTPQPMIDYTARWLLDHLPAPRAATLVHNDFRNGNLMIDPSKGIVAVLDWEVAHIGDPLRDLGWLCTNSWRFGESAKPVGGFGEIKHLIDAYEAASGTEVDAASLHFWQVFGSFWWAIGCLLMAQYYRDGRDATVERPAIGRRSSECQIDCVNLIIPGPAELPAAAPVDDSALPSQLEILKSVEDFLRHELSGEVEGRSSFLARVAANSLDIVAREQSLGPAARAAEHERLKTLLNNEGALTELRWQLVHALRNGEIALADDNLIHHLRNTTLAELAIDQPRYSGYLAALAQT